MLLPLLLPLLAALPRPTTALPCAIFDASDALYLFGTGPSHSTDLALGASPSSWASQTTTLSAQGDRPPFDAQNTQCFLNQYKDGLVVLFADQANPSDVHLYDFKGSSWSVQKTTTPPTGIEAAVGSLDHDTNTLYAYLPSSAELFFLNLDASTAAASAQPVAWTQSNNPDAAFKPYKGTDRRPTLGAASNHLHFIDAADGSTDNVAGQVRIFVIHFAYWQPEPQAIAPNASSPAIPATPGRTVSIPVQANTVPLSFAFFPDPPQLDHAFVVDMVSNTSAAYRPPPTTDHAASYAAASSDLLVQFDYDAGKLAYLDLTQPNPAWSAVSNAAIQSSSGSSNSSSSASASGSASSSKTDTKSGAATATTRSSSTNGASTTATASPTDTGAALALTLTSPILTAFALVLAGAALLL